MKKNIKQVISLNLTLDSSEMIMFNKGGMFKSDFPLVYLEYLRVPTIDDNDSFNIPVTTSLEITIQMERNEQGMFDFIMSEAQRHKEDIRNENKSS